MLILTAKEFPVLTPRDWGILSLAATGAAFGQLAMNEGYRCLPVTTGASIQMLWPLLTALSGMWLFDERFAALQIVGAILILGATWRITVGKS